MFVFEVLYLITNIFYFRTCLWEITNSMFITLDYIFYWTNQFSDTVTKNNLNFLSSRFLSSTFLFCCKASK